MSEDEQVPDQKAEAVEAGGGEAGGAALMVVPPKVDPQRRAQAALLDVGGVYLLAGVLNMVAMAIMPFVFGPIVGVAVWGAAAAYVAVRDSLNEGQSFGKQQMGLRVVTSKGRPCTMSESATRNALLAAPAALSAVGSMLSIVPILGWLAAVPVYFLAFVVGLAGLYETAQVFALDPKGRRLMELKAEAYTVEA